MRSVGGLTREALGGVGGDVGTGTPEKPKRGRGKGRANGNGKRRDSGSSKTGATGRLDHSGQEKVIDQLALSSNMSDMLGLHGKMQEAQIAFREKVKGVAEKSGYLASTVRSVVVAHSKGDEVVAEKKRAGEQLLLAFEAVGEA